MPLPDTRYLYLGTLPFGLTYCPVFLNVETGCYVRYVDGEYCDITHPNDLVRVFKLLP